MESKGEAHMNSLQRFGLTLAATAVCFLMTSGVGAPQVETKVQNAEVVYVEGNDLVLRLADGDVRQFQVSDSSEFTSDGKKVTVRELKPGMTVSAMVFTALAPKWVDTVETLQMGTVWKTIGGNMVIRTPQGENRMYRVPSGGKITLEGKEIRLDQLHEGDKITATVVKTRPSSAAGSVAAVAHHRPATPARVGALLIDEGAMPDEPPGMWGTTTIIILVAAIILVALLILLVMQRKRRARAK
jgi:hypothetical protein